MCSADGGGACMEIDSFVVPNDLNYINILYNKYISHEMD